MDYWILIFISVFNSGIYSEPVATYNTMDDCFEARELLIETIGRPIRNYQGICVLWNQDDNRVEKLLTNP